MPSSPGSIAGHAHPDTVRTMKPINERDQSRKTPPEALVLYFMLGIMALGIVYLSVGLIFFN